eukprot:jgi/Botrbrau1/12632/Bobra.0169s0157.1
MVGTRPPRCLRASWDLLTPPLSGVASQHWRLLPLLHDKRVPAKVFGQLVITCFGPQAGLCFETQDSPANSDSRSPPADVPP